MQVQFFLKMVLKSLGLRSLLLQPVFIKSIIASIFVASIFVTSIFVAAIFVASILVAFQNPDKVSYLLTFIYCCFLSWCQIANIKEELSILMMIAMITTYS